MNELYKEVIWGRNWTILKIKNKALIKPDIYVTMLNLFNDIYYFNFGQLLSECLTEHDVPNCAAKVIMHVYNIVHRCILMQSVGIIYQLY